MSLALLLEMAALHRRSMAGELSVDESERLGKLIQREQREAALRPGRIALLRQWADLLEDLELAQTRRAAPAGPVIDLVAEAA